MRAWGYAVVVASFVATALGAYAIIRAVKPDSADLALGVAAIVAGYVGVIIWRRQAPATTLLRVKLGLGILLSLTAVGFAVVFQLLTPWLRYPEITIPIAAVGCFIMPFVLAGTFWKALSKNKPPPASPD